MPTFHDNSGEAWCVSLSVDTVSHIRRETGVNLNDAFVRDRDGQTPVTRIAADPEQLVAMLYAACETQIKERGLEPRQFAARFDGDAIEAATAALAEALVDFSPKRHREPMRRALRKIEARIATSQPTDEELDALIDRTIAASLPERVMSTTPSTPSQAS